MFVRGITLAYRDQVRALNGVPGSQQLRRTVRKTTKVALFTALRNTRRKMGQRAQRLLVLRVLVHEAFLRMRKFSQLVPNHVLRYHDRDVVFPVVYEKADPNEIRKDGTRTRIRFYGSVVCKCFTNVRKRNEEWPFPCGPP